ncbi:L,D-transpeptidase [Pectobacterium brasiliense]|uniref:L,D-transpeptidase family protein n=1 Tax=Pectobacterium TaxID=122277 RepID=UPI0004E68D78|nr:L,D-transpeptidase family protein [Pectobacterium brasiliense]GKV78497.1 transpeptidase [Pectobacterium carotovorum subsp. carotovorum]APS28843.1 L,D-transpeptidase [Pectobacterium brasiliense]ARA77677.1 L,D-transpeptidase [Pectobacterium brasiliense]ATV43966.1 L,D-transpeptidase [Pectobacterium brasiliense]KFF68157.1 L,D-transpeptidase [Pectobacterium brasiliense]
MSIRAIFTLVLAAAAFSQAAFAVVYPLPAANSRLVGENIEITVPEDSTQPLEHFAAQFQMGLSNMMEANPDADVYLPIPGSKMVIPHQLILPDAPREGIVINSAEMRLYYYPKGSKTVVVLPIGIGELGKDTPINWTTSVQRKKAGPTWTPTAKMHAEYAARGETLQKVFPAGPDNPMGLYALYIGNLYAIHGTNANFGIGLRVSHGCVRLRADDIKYLFNNVPVGTRVQFINEPVKATVEPDGSRYVEVHNPLSRTVEEFHSDSPAPISMTPKVSKVLADASVNTSEVDQAIQRRSGMPTKINGLIEQATPAIPVESVAAPVAPEAQPQDSLNAVQNAAPAESQPTAAATDASRS